MMSLSAVSTFAAWERDPALMSSQSSRNSFASRVYNNIVILSLTHVRCQAYYYY